MYLTQSNVIRGLSKQEYTMLREMCQYSNNLYNVAVYTIRQHYFNTHQFLRYEENYPICKENENYSLLQAGVAQQILKMADRSFRSFFGLLQKAKAGDYQSKDVRLPHYREKGGWFHLVLSTNAINIKNGFLTVPLSRKYAKIHNGHRIPVPDRMKEKTIQEVRICPMYGGRYFKIQYGYLQEESYTSQASCLDLDDIPVYQPDAPYTGTFSGKRIRRGLYRFANGRTANADINGAANILRKSKQNFDFEGLCKGLLDSPLRIRLS